MSRFSMASSFSWYFCRIYPGFFPYYRRILSWLFYLLSPHFILAFSLIIAAFYPGFFTSFYPGFFTYYSSGLNFQLTLVFTFLSALGFLSFFQYNKIIINFSFIRFFEWLIFWCFNCFLYPPFSTYTIFLDSFFFDIASGVCDICFFYFTVLFFLDRTSYLLGIVEILLLILIHFCFILLVIKKISFLFKNKTHIFSFFRRKFVSASQCVP